MRQSKIVVLVVAILGLLFGPTHEAKADLGAAPGGGAVSCLVNNPGSGALAIRGAVAIEIISGFGFGGTHEADFTLRLERSGVQHFFRVKLVTPLGALTQEEIACRVLNPNDTTDPIVVAAVTNLVNQILIAFDLPGRRLVITNTSISETDGGAAVPGTGRGSSVANITIYAVSP